MKVKELPDKDLFIEMFKVNNIYQMAEYFKVGTGVITKWSKIFDFQKINYWTQKEDNLLCENYLTKSKEDMLILFPNRSWGTIITRATTLRIGSRRASGLAHRKWTFDFNYFEVIDTQEKAYWLGFIYADGSVRKIGNSGQLRVKLHNEALIHLEKFKKSILYDGPIYGPDKKGGFGIELSHPKLILDLIDKGVVPRKTWCVSYPNIPKKLNQHFIRGLFDGDGSASESRHKYLEKIYRTGTLMVACGAVDKFLEDVRDVICIEANVEPNKVIVHKHKDHNDVYSISWQGTPAMRVRDYLYKDSVVWMEYKRNILFSYDYSYLRPQDKQHQEAIIDELANKRGWNRLSEYNGRDENMSFQCDKGHIYTTTVNMFKLEKGCPKCHDICTGEKQIDIGKDNLLKIFNSRNWKLRSDYSSNGEIEIECEHGKTFVRKRRSAIQKNAQCDCVKINCLEHGKEQLLSRLKLLNWELVSDYTGFFDYIKVKCQHGAIFDRIGGNIKAKSKCPCQNISGHKGVYKTGSGKWQGRVRYNDKEISVGVFDTIEKAVLAIKKFKEFNYVSI